LSGTGQVYDLSGASARSHLGSSGAVAGRLTAGGIEVNEIHVDTRKAR
jgi:hypothetical protein